MKTGFLYKFFSRNQNTLFPVHAKQQGVYCIFQQLTESLIWPKQHHMTYNRFFYKVPTESVATYFSYSLFIEVSALFFQTSFYCFFHTIITLQNVASALKTISLLISISKIFEKILYNRLYHHIVDNHILSNEQFGFRQALSTDSASYHLISNILTALNSKLSVGGIFCGLHKAIDSVNYDILLSKMELYGITGTAYKLIKSYLLDTRWFKYDRD
jgi:hypothetical protein